MLGASNSSALACLARYPPLDADPTGFIYNRWKNILLVSATSRMHQQALSYQLSFALQTSKPLKTNPSLRQLAYCAFAMDCYSRLHHFFTKRIKITTQLVFARSAVMFLYVFALCLVVLNASLSWGFGALVKAQLLFAARNRLKI